MAQPMPFSIDVGHEGYLVPIWLRFVCDLVTIWLRENQFGYGFGYEIDVFGYDLVTGRPVPGTIWLRAIWLRFGYEAAEKCGRYCKNTFSPIFFVRLALCRRNQIIWLRLPRLAG